MKLKITHDKLIIQPKCAFFCYFGFSNFDLHGWRVQIRNQRLCKCRVPNSIQVKLLLVFFTVIFGLAVRFAPEAFLALPLLYLKYIIKLPNVCQKQQKRSFKLAIH